MRHKVAEKKTDSRL